MNLSTLIKQYFPATNNDITIDVVAAQYRETFLDDNELEQLW